MNRKEIISRCTHSYTSIGGKVVRCVIVDSWQYKARVCNENGVFVMLRKTDLTPLNKQLTDKRKQL